MLSPNAWPDSPPEENRHESFLLRNTLVYINYTLLIFFRALGERLQICILNNRREKNRLHMNSSLRESDICALPKIFSARGA